MTIGKSCRVINYVNGRVRAILCDCRTFMGTMVAFDKHMNIILQDAVELRKYKPKREKKVVEEKRTLGFILLRGENIVSVMLEATADEMSESPRSRSTSVSSSSAYSARW